METTRYEYPKRWKQAVTIAWTFLVAFGVMEYALEWVRAVYAVLYSLFELPLVVFLDPYQRVLPTLLVSNLGFGAAMVTARAIAFLAPSYSIQEDAIVATCRFGKRVIPFNSVQKVYSSELEEGRFIVWVQAKKGLPLQGFLGSLLFTLFLRRGFLISSDLVGFDAILARVVGELRSKHEEDLDKYVIEIAPTWLMAMLSEPGKTVKRLASEEIVPISQHDAIWLMCSVSMSLVFAYSVYGIIHLTVPWGALILFLLALAEFPLVAAFWSAIPIGDGPGMRFVEGIRLYPVTMLPRWAIGFVLLILLVAGAPIVFLVPTVLAGVALGCAMSVQLVQDWFKVEMPTSLLGALVTIIYQVFLFEVFLALLPH